MKNARIAIMAATTVLFVAVVFTACEDDDPPIPSNEYTVDGTKYSIDTAYATVNHMTGIKEWRMLGKAFAGASADPGPAANLLKFTPNLGTGDLEGEYTVDNSEEPEVGTFTYGFTANYDGSITYDSTTVDNPTGTLVITKFDNNIYEFKLEGGKLILGNWDWSTFQFVASGYEPSYSVYYKGPVTPAVE